MNKKIKSAIADDCDDGGALNVANGQAEKDMERLGLHVLSGLHAGALIDMGGKSQWTLGSGEGVDILLADDGLAEQQCNFAFDTEGDAWQLESSADGVAVFGVPLPVGSAVRIRVGTCVSVSGVDMTVIQLQEALVPEHPVMILAVSERQLAAARRAALWQLDRRAYARVLLQESRRLRYLPWAVLALLLIVAGIRHHLDYGYAEREPSREAHDYIRRAFPDVKVDYEKSTGNTIYAGYVSAQRDLDYLRTLAMAADQGQSVIRVVPMEALAMNASLLLDEYYRDAVVNVTGPGSVHVALIADDAVKALKGWDFSGVSAVVRRELPELHDVTISVTKANSARVDVPYSALDYSVLPTRDDTYFAVNPRGERLFAGAAVKEGRLTRIGPCGVALASGAALFEFSADETLSCSYEKAVNHREKPDTSTVP